MTNLRLYIMVTALNFVGEMKYLNAIVDPQLVFTINYKCKLPVQENWT